MQRFHGIIIEITMLGFLFVAVPVVGQSLLIGHWQGVTLIQPAKFEVGIETDFFQAPSGALAGRLSFTTNGDYDRPVHSLSIEGRKVRFGVTDDQGVLSSFEGWLSEDGESITGDLEEQGGHYLFTLQRVAREGAPQIQRRLLSLSPNGAELKELFNRDPSSIRLLVILSASCPMCKSGAGIIQRYLLEKVMSPRLAVYVIWEPVVSGDTEEAAIAASRFIDDPRVVQFWAESRFTGQAFEWAFGVAGSPVWDVYILFADGQTWGDTVPKPSFIMSNLVAKGSLPTLPHLDGAELTAKVKSLLARGGGAPAEKNSISKEDRRKAL
jgi:hypothetical protein